MSQVMPDAAVSVLGGADAGDDPAVLALCFVGDTTLFTGNTEGTITIWSGASTGPHLCTSCGCTWSCCLLYSRAPFENFLIWLSLIAVLSLCSLCLPWCVVACVCVVPCVCCPLCVCCPFCVLSPVCVSLKLRLYVSVSVSVYLLVLMLIL